MGTQILVQTQNKVLFSTDSIFENSDPKFKFTFRIILP